jgi:hypothetical protein
MNKCYIGNTQEHVKTRMQGHVQDVKNLFISDKSSDSFASHFASLIPEGTVKKNHQRPGKSRNQNKVGHFQINI